jgi:hypothetical protein
MDSTAISQHIGAVIAAIGGLGTAAFGLIDATKVFWGGVNNFGFSGIRKRIEGFIPPRTVNGLKLEDVLATLQQNWFTGTDLASQKAIAKSLIKLNFNEATAKQMADATGLDPGALATIAQSQTKGASLTTPQSDVYARFDAILTAQLDATYRRADETYVNATRACAVPVSVILAVAGAWALKPAWPPSELWPAVLIGLLATPLAPIAKDLSTALATAVNTMQLVKR